MFYKFLRFKYLEFGACMLVILELWCLKTCLQWSVNKKKLARQRCFFSCMSSLSSSSDLHSEDVHTKQHTSYDDTAWPTQAKNYPDSHKSRLKCLICGRSPKESQETQRLVFYTYLGARSNETKMASHYSKQSVLNDLADCWHVLS